MQPKIYFISGVCGVGKSSLIPHLKNILPTDKFDVRDFDERGVPDGADRNWRKGEVKNWLEVGKLSALEGISTVVCGFVKRTDFEEASNKNIPEIKTVLLDADSKTIRERLAGRYSVNGIFDETKKVIGKPVTEFIESNVYYCDIMRKECMEEGWDVIKTPGLTPEEVARKVSKLVNL
jgi:broad-specificity NMP kinase